jgi:branched-chain amino acid transport system permease protein
MLLTWALYLPFRGGQMYFGSIYCMAIGAYSAAFMVRDVGWPLWLALIIAVVIGAIVGFIPSWGLVRTTGVATGMASVALIFIIQAVIRNLEFLGGSNGLLNIPRVGYLQPLSYLSVLIVGIFLYRLEHSHLGRAMEAMLDDPSLASSMGVNTIILNVFSLTVSSAIGALAGVIFAFNLGGIFPDTFSFYLLLYTSTMMFVGGRYTMWGAVVAAPILSGLPQWLPNVVAQYTNIIYGALLVIILMVRPQGVITRDLLQRISKGVKILKLRKASK